MSMVRRFLTLFDLRQDFKPDLVTREIERTLDYMYRPHRGDDEYPSVRVNDYGRLASLVLYQGEKIRELQEIVQRLRSKEHEP